MVRRRTIGLAAPGAVGVQQIHHLRRLPITERQGPAEGPRRRPYSWRTSLIGWSSTSFQPPLTASPRHHALNTEPAEVALLHAVGEETPDRVAQAFGLTM